MIWIGGSLLLCFFFLALAVDRYSREMTQWVSGIFGTLFLLMAIFGAIFSISTQNSIKIETKTTQLKNGVVVLKHTWHDVGLRSAIDFPINTDSWYESKVNGTTVIISDDEARKLQGAL
jgi:hypothetical protein